MAKKSQLKLMQDLPKAYGGELLKTREGRVQGRPLDTKNSMHLVLRSSKAKGLWAFNRHGNDRKIRDIVFKFALKYGVHVQSLANVGNHLHFQIKLSTRYGYRPFIRAITAAIAMAVTGRNRWSKHAGQEKLKFWDYRPFTKVVQSFRAFLNLRDYIKINQLEGRGYSKNQARFLIEWDHHRPAKISTA